LDYHCIVCVKQVPDTARVTADAMKADGTVNRSALPAIMNPDDLHALEAALAIREQHGGTVTAITMGPLGAAEVLRECLYRGADRVLLINDRRAAASDTLATSYILSQAIRKLGAHDIVFCGRQAIDGDTAQVGPQLAEKLGLVQVTYLDRFLELADRTARVRRDVGNGWEVLEVRLPVLVTILDTANRPRPPSARRVMRCKRARTAGEVKRGIAEDAEAQIEALRADDLLLEQWDLDDIDADLQWCGVNGSPTKVHRVQSIVLTKAGYKEIPPTEPGISEMVHELIVDHTLG
jgi:electron transfer flavoprotein beta subunit